MKNFETVMLLSFSTNAVVLHSVMPMVSEDHVLEAR